MRVKSWVLVVLCLGCSVHVPAATYYVSKTGSDAGSGSSSSPWLTIQKAANTMIAGDMAIVLSGRYSETVTTVRAGSAGGPIVFRGQGASLLRVKLHHAFNYLENFEITGTDSPNGAALHVAASNLRITGNQFHSINTNTYGILTVLATGRVPLPYVTNLYIAGNSFRRVFGHNICVFADRSLIESNRISETFMDAFRIWGEYTTVRGNIISNIYVEGSNHPDVIQTFNAGTDHYSRFIVFENNQSLNSYCQPCNLSNSTNPNLGDWTFRNNLFAHIYGQGNVGIPRVRWINNTFYRVASNLNYAVTFLKQVDFDGEDGEVFNNAFVECGKFDSGTFGFYYTAAAITNRFTADYNYVAGHGPAYGSKSGFKEMHGVNGGNPWFANLSAHEFVWTSNSPAIDRALAQSDFNYDIRMVRRPVGSGWDIGAYENGMTTPPPPPPVASAIVTLTNLAHIYNGVIKSATVDTVPAGLAVQLSYNGTPLNAGSYLVTANVTDPAYQGSATGTLSISKASQSINFAPIPDQQLTNTVRLSALASSGLSPAYAIVAGPGMISASSNLTFTSTGVVLVAASQSGNTNWLAAVAVTNPVAVTGAPITGGVTYYISPAGNDADTGDFTRPFRTIQKAANVMWPGDRAIAMAGRYAETVTTVRAGTDLSPIVFSGMDASLLRFKLKHSFNEIRNIEFSGGNTPDAATVQVEAGNVRITGNRFVDIGTNMYGILTVNDAGRIPWPYVTNLYIGGNTFRRVYGHNVCLFADHSLVESNRINDTFMDVFRIWGEYTVIRGNVISNIYVAGSNHPDVIQTFGEVGTNHYSRYIVFENNESYDSYCQPCNLSNSGNTNMYEWTFRNNIFAGIYGQGNMGIPRVKWLNNTFYRSASNLAHAITFLKQPQFDGEDGVVMNNLFIACGKFEQGDYGFYSVASAITNRFTADYNFVAGLPPAFPAKSAFKEVHGINGGDPQFINRTAYDFRLSPASAAIDRALTLPEFTYDRIGVIRPAGAAWDMGAYEAASTSPPPPVWRASVVISNLYHTYDGTVQSVDVSTWPTGLLVDVSYSAQPLNAGSYQVVAIVRDPVYEGGATNNIVIARAAQSISFGPISAQDVTNRLGLSASASSGNTVDFALISGPALLSGMTNLSFTSTGAVSVVARQDGSTNWLAAPAITNSFPVLSVSTSPPSSGPTTYYIAPSGQDTHAGTITSPWRTIQKAANSMLPGDTAIVMRGRYSETVTTVRAGTALAPVTFRGDGDASVIRFKLHHAFNRLENFDLSGGDVPNGAAVHVAASNVRITGNRFVDIGTNMYGILTVMPNGTVPWPYVTNLYIGENTFRRVYGHNVCVFADRSVIESNRIHDTFMDGFRIWGEYTTIRGNTVSNLYVEGSNHPDVIQTFGSAGTNHYSRHIVFENNMAFDSYCQPCNLSNSGNPLIGDWTFRNNVFANIYGQGNMGIPRVRWINNTFYRVASNLNYAITFLKQTDFDGEDGVVQNNAFVACGKYDTGAYGYYYVAPAISNRFTADYNYVAGFPPAYAAKSGFTEPRGVNGGDPRFANATGLDFMIAADSPALERGMTQSGFNYDIRGMLRPLGRKWDIGAYEDAADLPAPPKPPKKVRPN